jgi:hypothetical protein
MLTPTSPTLTLPVPAFTIEPVLNWGGVINRLFPAATEMRPLRGRI